MSTAEKKKQNILNTAKAERDKFVALLVEELQKERLAFFLGAGCSIEAGLPSWETLINVQLEKYNIKTNDKNLIRLATRLEKDVGPIKFRENIVESLTIGHRTQNKLLQILSSFGVNLYITTNYDHLLEETFSHQGYPYQIIWNQNDIPSIDPSKRVIVKLHGDLNSPTSLIATSRDYLKYKTDQKIFVDWLNATAARYSIVFLGTSFEDPRLKEMDDHILGLFGAFRLNPFIFLKIPEQGASSDDIYDIQIDDFDFICDDFRSKGFNVAVIDKYDDIQAILGQARDRLLKENYRKKTADFHSNYVQLDYTQSIENKLNSLIDATILELAENVRGGGRLPVPSEVQKNNDKLIAFLKKPPHSLSPDSKMEGLLTIADAILNTDKNNRLPKSREFYEEAVDIYERDISDKYKWTERLLRVRAKLLFFEGKKKESVDSLSGSQDEKTRGLWLALLIDSNRLEEAYEFVVSTPSHPLWTSEALFVLINKGDISKAEELFSKTISEFEKVKKAGDIKESVYKGDFYCEKICFSMASALYQRVLASAGQNRIKQLLPFQITGEIEEVFERVLKIINLLFKYSSRQKLNESFFAYQACRLEQHILNLKGDYAAADRVAREIISIRPLDEGTLRYVVRRAAFFDKELLKKVCEQVQEDHPDKAWAWLLVSVLEAMYFNEKDKGWVAFKKAVSNAVSLEDKKEIANIVLELSPAMNRVEEAYSLTISLFEEHDVIRVFLSSCYQYRIGNKELALESLKQILSRAEVPPSIQAEIKIIFADHAISQERLEEAKQLLIESNDINFNPYTLKQLLYVVTRLQDDNEALRIIDKLSVLGLEDDPQIIHVRAQINRNFGLYEKSEKDWRKLTKLEKNNAEYAYRLGEVLSLQDKQEEALIVLEGFIQPDDKIDLNCLVLACDIYISTERFSDAFNLVNNCYGKIQDEPRLLQRHVDLGFRTDHEDEAHQSLVRLQLLQEQGKVPNLIQTKTIDEVIDFFKQNRESKAKLNDQYRLGQQPWIFLTEHYNRPLYLDWAIRTQDLGKIRVRQDEITDFTLYSTNSFRVQYDKKNKNQLVSIIAPDNVGEIVIDNHALITIHRLGLLDRLGKKYKKVYYPAILKAIWQNDQQRYHYHQLSKEKVLRKLNERLQSQQIKESLSTLSLSEFDNTALSVNLAEIENVPLVSAYLKKEEKLRTSKAVVIRLSELITWLYEKGRLSETKWKQIKNVSGEEPSMHSDYAQYLERSWKIVFDGITLELFEQYGLTQLLLDMGVQIFVEKSTANVINTAVREIGFLEQVGKWHRELSESVKRLKFFIPITIRIEGLDKQLKHRLSLQGLFTALEFAEKEGHYLLTDDRFSQMVRTEKMQDKQFGTDALLRNLYEDKILSIEEYSDAFLKLCEWRYRFLIPDVSILVYLAKQYVNNPPGDSLESIANYSRRCMEDRGLFLGPERTDPPMPIGLKFYLSWLDVWVNFLIQTWQDEDFNDRKLQELAKWVFHYALPDVPKGFSEEAKLNVMNMEEHLIITKLFAGVASVKNPARFYQLFEFCFGILEFNSERKNEELLKYLDLLSSNSNIKKEVKKYVAGRTIEAFFGKRAGIHLEPKLALALKKCGLVLVKNEIDQSDAVLNQFKDQAVEPQLRKNLPIFQREPILTFLPENKVTTVHNIISHPDYATRSKVVGIILSADYISDYTKDIIRSKSNQLLSTIETEWTIASEDAKKALLSDFTYALSLFDQSLTSPFHVNDLIDVAWKATLTPNIDSIIDQLPLLIKTHWNASLIKQNINDATSNYSINEILNYFLREIYFMPVGNDLKPWNILKQYLSRESNFAENAKGYVYKDTNLLHSINSWANQDIADPMALLVALDLILHLRKRVNPFEQDEFANDDFYQSLDRLFEVLLSEDEVKTPGIAKSLTAKFIVNWKLRKELAHYYLQYIDLNGRKDFDDDEKIAISWWLAREVSLALLKRISSYDIDDQIDWLEENAIRITRIEQDRMDRVHFFKDKRKVMSVGRYFTLEGKAPLAIATMSMIMPAGTDDSSCFLGLVKPTNAFSPKFTDLVIQSLTSRTILGEGQFYKTEEQNSSLSLLWDISICTSAPSFFRNYYADSFDLLGKEKVDLIRLAESVATPDYLDHELQKLDQYLVESKGPAVTLILVSLKMYVYSRGAMPESASVFQKLNSSLVDSMFRLERPWNTLTVLLFISIYVSQIKTENQEWVKIFEQLFQNVDYLKIDDEDILRILLELISTVVLTGNDRLLIKLLSKKYTSKGVRDALSKFKSNLEYAFPLIAIEYRPNIRMILEHLSDIPTIDNNKK